MPSDMETVFCPVRLFFWIGLQRCSVVLSVLILTPLTSTSSNFTPFNSLAHLCLWLRTWKELDEILMSSFQRGSPHIRRSVCLNSNQVCLQVSKVSEPVMICAACTLSHISLSQTTCWVRQVSELLISTLTSDEASPGTRVCVHV